ncbi:MAG: hypothetical protein NVS9B15_22710 [Acidobacteriaceae bacterium]
MNGRVIARALLAGVLSCSVGTIVLFGAFYFLIHAAESYAGTKLLNDSPMGMFQQNPSAAAFAIGGVAFAWFAFGFFITYSRLSSREELGR